METTTTEQVKYTIRIVKEEHDIYGIRFYNETITLYYIILTLVPVSVFFEGVEYFLGVGMHQVSPRLPQRVHDVIDESDLCTENTIVILYCNRVGGIVNRVPSTFGYRITCDFSIVALCLSHIGLMSRFCSRSLSPCWKNSSINRSTHRLYSSNGLVGLLKSAQCTKFCKTCSENVHI